MTGNQLGETDEHIRHPADWLVHMSKNLGRNNTVQLHRRKLDMPGKEWNQPSKVGIYTAWKAVKWPYPKYVLVCVGLLQALTELRVTFFIPQQYSNSLSGLAPNLPLSQEAVMFTIATAWLEPCANDPHFIVLGYTIVTQIIELVGDHRFDIIPAVSTSSCIYICIMLFSLPSQIFEYMHLHWMYPLA